MERLNNDLMQRTIQRRQRMQDARAPQQDEASLAEPGPRSPLSRRSPLSEQNTRPGQSAQAGPPTALNRPPLPPAAGAHPGMGANWRSASAYSDQRLPPRQQRDDDYPARRTEPENRALYQQLPPKYVQTPRRRSTADYDETYPPMPSADAQDEWDGAAAMRYGDWEGEEFEEEIYTRPHADSIPSPLLTRELPAITARDLEARAQSQMQRNARPRSASAYIPQPQSPTLPPPAAQPPTQEPGNYHRNTQPLNPRNVAGMRPDVPQRGARLAQEQATSHNAKAREEQPPSSVFIPPPLAPKNVCPNCKGAGYLRIDVPYGHPNFGKPVPCHCKEVERHEKRRQYLRNVSNLGAFQNKHFKNFDFHVPGVQEAFQVAYDYAQNREGWLLLTGPNGCGKTHLAAAIANRALDEGALVLFAVVPDLLLDLRATLGPTATEAHDQLFLKMREVELLILDDLGAHKSSPWTTEKLFQLLNYRYNSRFLTVITANTQGLQGIDERIRSRLNDISLVTKVRFDRAQDYRPYNPRRD